MSQAGTGESALRLVDRAYPPCPQRSHKWWVWLEADWAPWIIDP